MPGGLVSLVIAILLDLTWGDPSNRFHPVAAMGAFINWAGKVFNARTTAGQFVHGLLLVISGVLVFSLPLVLLLRFLAFLPNWMQWVLTGLLLKAVLAWRRLIEAGLQVENELLAGNLAEARRLVSWHLVSRDTGELSEGQVASAAIESLAENLTDSLSAPLFYFLLLGLPGAWAYRFVNTADAMIGYHTPQYEYLGKSAARLDDGLNWLPARAAGVLLVAAAWLCRLDADSAWRVMADQHGRTSSPNAGWTMAAAAGALGVRLEKTRAYLLNEGQSLPNAADIHQACRLVSVAALLNMFLLGACALGVSYAI